MNVVVAYCCPTVERWTYVPLAHQFATTYRAHPAGYKHELVVVYNGQPPLPVDKKAFEGMDRMELHHDNSGWDIGAFQLTANLVEADFMVFLGAHMRFNHDGWLSRLCDAYLEFGIGLYGPWGAEYPHVHVRTTAFACPPQVLLSYPYPVRSDRKSRYAFEHGPFSITKFALRMGMPAVMVTMEGSFPFPDWAKHIPDAEHSIMIDKQHAV